MHDRVKSFLTKYRISWQAVLFIFALLFSAVILFASVIATHGEVLASLFVADKNDSFMDFYHTVYDSFLSVPYEMGTIYPPFCYLIYEFFSMFIPYDTLIHGGFAIRMSQEGRFAFLLYTVLSLTLLIIAVYCAKKGRRGERWAFIFCILLSAPFLYLLERGNIILLSFIFLLLFSAMYNSEKPLIKETSYICLAISACIKIYPAIFGLFLLRDRKYKDAVRCIAYASILFFVPFVFYGGMSGVVQMVKNIFEETDNIIDGHGVGYIISYSAIISIFRNLAAGQEFAIGAFDNASSLVISLLCMLSFFFVKEEWKRWLSLTVVICGYPSFSYEYSLIFMFVPIILFLDSKLSLSPKNFLYACLLICSVIFVPFVRANAFPEHNFFDRPILLYCVINGLSLLLLSLLVIYDGAVGVYGWMRNIKASRASSERI